MVAYGKGNNQYSIRKKIYEKIRVIGNIKAMWIVFSQKQNYKKREINDSKDIKDIPSTSYSKTKSQTTMMIRNNL